MVDFQPIEQSKIIGKKGEKRDEPAEQSRSGKVQRSEGCHAQAYAHAYGYAEMRRSVHLPLLQVST